MARAEEARSSAGHDVPDGLHAGQDLARLQRARDRPVAASVSLIPTEERGFKLAVELAVTLPSVTDADQAVALVQAAHGVCPYSNATRGNIDVHLTANGAEVEHE